MTTLQHVSEKPWADYTAADYTPEQYKAACLVVRGDGSSKAMCKLPVKTPGGALSRAGVHAAAAALAGARGGVDLTPDERASAEKKLKAYYGQLGEDPPPSLAHALFALVQALDDDAQQHGVKGQKWGVTNDGKGGTSAGSKKALESYGKFYVKKQLGDKTYWKKVGLAGAAVGTAAAAIHFAPAVLPAAAFVHAGGPAAFTAMATKGQLALWTGVRIQQYRANVARFNAKRAAQIRALAHADLSSTGLTAQDVYDRMTPAHLQTLHILVGAFAKDLDLTDDTDLQASWDTFSDEEKALTYFIADIGRAQSEDEPVAHSDADDVIRSIVEVEEDDAEQHGIRGQKWGVRRKVDSSTGLVTGGLKPRTGSADQIAQDRVAAKIKKGGAEAVSNADIQAYVKRVQLQADLNRVLAQQSAADKAKADGFIKKFVKKQAVRQTDRIANAAVDIAVEQALKKAGLTIKDKGNEDLGDSLVTLSSRIKPKKK